ncbi:MAG: hypothetical protein ACRCYO_16795 [Bacteroidia bacterium]
MKTFTPEFLRAEEALFRAAAGGGGEQKLAAIQRLCKQFEIDRGHAIFTYDPAITGAYAVAFSDTDVRFGPLCFEPYTEFGLLLRVIAHEVLHVHQKTKLFPIKSHNERELLAYCDTIFRTDLPPISDKATLRFFVSKGLKYYNALSAWKKFRYRGLSIRLLEEELRLGK